MKIILTQDEATGKFNAHLEEDPQNIGIGRTPAEAVGHLVLDRLGAFNLVIENQY